MKSVEGKVRKAAGLYGLIEDGDRIAVGVSGGKDSVALLHALASLSRYSESEFTLVAVIADERFGGADTDYTSILKLCDDLSVSAVIRRSNISEVVFDIKNELNPCSLCARMRRGILHDMAVDAGCGKIALGHHMDDAVETLFLNLFHQSRLESFRPKTYLSRKNITMIRPLVLCSEEETRAYVRRLGLPVVKSRCPMDGRSERETIKSFIREKEKEYPGFTRRTFHAMQSGGISGFGVTR